MRAGDLVGFVSYLFEQKNHDTLWSIWLAKDIEEPFEDFKKKGMPNARKKEIKETSDEQANKNIEFASQFVTARKEK
ncbi:hypothetical protein [Weissella tructae]|uniref:hypothetical protein n=1 Tax=Weissella tructae TaxID=887702 RepID=UPI001BDBC365|nr:hypothetical protein [Weissella tructae]QVV90820.1 hypothetical protein KHQ32_04080 [Weissella tructae]